MEKRMLLPKLVPVGASYVKIPLSKRAAMRVILETVQRGSRYWIAGIVAPVKGKPPTLSPTQSRTNQVLAGARSGNSSSIRLFRQVGSFSKVSRSHAAGSKPLRRAVASRL